MMNISILMLYIITQGGIKSNGEPQFTEKITTYTELVTHNKLVY